MEAHELEQLLNKVGGKFKLVVLCQKRMRELQRGLPKLVLTDSSNQWEVVSKEIMGSKVDLMMGEEADQMRKELAARESEEAGEGDAKGEPAKLPAKAPEQSK